METTGKIKTATLRELNDSYNLTLRPVIVHAGKLSGFGPVWG